MSKLWGRIVLAALALPALFTIVYWLPHFSFLAYNLGCVAGAAIGALEVRNMVERRGLRTYRWLAPIMAATIPMASYFEARGWIETHHVAMGLAIAATVVLLRSLLMNNTVDLAAVLARVSTAFLVLIYPGVFLYFLARISTLDDASVRLVLFFAMVFANDSMAYGVGTLFGRSLGLIISPKKSLIGFVAGFAAAVLVAVGTEYFFPGVLPGGMGAALVVGASVGVSTILGDLFESTLKRSAAVKDSGTIMMGRGGFLDSIDSMLMSAPVFYLVIRLLEKM